MPRRSSLRLLSPCYVASWSSNRSVSCRTAMVLFTRVHYQSVCSLLIHVSSYVAKWKVSWALILRQTRYDGLSYCLSKLFFGLILRFDGIVDDHFANIATGPKWEHPMRWHDISTRHDGKGHHGGLHFVRHLECAALELHQLARSRPSSLREGRQMNTLLMPSVGNCIYMQNEWQHR